jgi:hypothetical protein
LPKPLLVIAKNLRHIDEAKVGLTGPVPIPGGFDNQAAYADIKANVTVPGTTGSAAAAGNAPLSAAVAGTALPLSIQPEAMTPAGRVEDGLNPDSFYTYQVVFIPDLSQKYGIRVKGGAGEMRASMNLVNGWMYTGLGPFYLKDSSTAQNIMACGVSAMYTGRGVADVVSSVGDLKDLVSEARREGGDRPAIESEDFVRVVQELADVVSSQRLVPQQMLNFAEVFIYEPVLTQDCGTDWRLVAEHRFDRHYFTSSASDAETKMLGDLLGNFMNLRKAESAERVQRNTPMQEANPGKTTPESGGRNDRASELEESTGGAAAPPASAGNASGLLGSERINLNIIGQSNDHVVKPAAPINCLDLFRRKTPTISDTVGNTTLSPRN